MKKVVFFGGGTGAFTVLSGLKKHPIELTAIVTMADDGGSAGILREEFGVLPPGDIRRALLALSETDNEVLLPLFNYRFKEGAGLNGHNFGNLMLTALERITGNLPTAIKEAEKILSVKGAVVPVTLYKSKLFAGLDDGQVIKGETNIDIPKHDGRIKIKKVWLKPKSYINPVAERAIASAEAIIIGPGDLYTSIIPNLLVIGVTEAIKKSKAKKIYIVNVMTKFGETNNFSAGDFITEINNYLGDNILDYALVNSKLPSYWRMRNYILERASAVQIEGLPEKPSPVFGDFLRTRGFVRHDSDKLARVIVSLI
ncbi:MAG: YvcK family protein [Candidatus Colwellbacteria bacterium]|nr:YvcK family protein [Candidatus Colwellbacteria bacterium]